ncbi:MAG: GerW family sporulation protein [Firmicutes bacterium]|nr:GerW family sporulation protein [Bacillota bacterium]
MGEHPLHSLMQTAMENLKAMVDVNTIVGDAVQTPDGSVILPISRVGFGFAAGGSEFGASKPATAVAATGGVAGVEAPFGGGAGAGVSINPMGFLVVTPDGVRLLSTQTGSQLYDRLIDMAPMVLDRIERFVSPERGKHDNRGTSVQESALS